MLQAREGGKLHAPFAGGACDGCHTPHAAGKAGLVKPEVGAVCLQCHIGIQKIWVRARSKHQPFARGKCTACHDPHGSKEPKLLARGPEALCLGCHGALKARLAKPGATVHAPVDGGGCLGCHRGHASDQPKLLVDAVPQLCAGCHELGSPDLAAAHGGWSVERARCTACHDPHVSDGGKLLLDGGHPPLDGGDCDSCHEAPPRAPLPAPER